MITRKALITKLEAMNRGDVLISQADYRNAHHLSALPLPKTLAKLVGVQSIEPRRYTNKRGDERTNPAWLIAAYKTLAQFIHDGHDINVRMMIWTITH